MAENVRLMLSTPPAEDHAGYAYQEVAENRAAVSMSEEFMRLLEGDQVAAPAAKPAAGGTGNPDFDALISGGDQAAPAPTTAGAEPAAAPAAPDAGSDPQLMGYEPAGNDTLVTKAMQWAKSAAVDVGASMPEIPRQAVGGVLDALGEMDQFMQDVLPIGGAQLFDEAGNFDPSFVSNAQMMAGEKANTDLFSMIAPEKSDHVVAGFARATTQFLTGFIPGLQATKGMAAIKGGAMLSNMAAGAIADMVVFDPNQDRLSTFLNQVPALSSLVPDYLADNAPDQSHWEGRLKNAIEGAGLGLATDGLLSAFKYYKAAAKARALDKAASDPVGATVEAAKDELKQAARTELVQDIPDEALHPLGDAAPDAPLLVEAPANATATDAFKRLGDARTRAAEHDANSVAMDAVNAARERYVKGKGGPAPSVLSDAQGKPIVLYRGENSRNAKGGLWYTPDKATASAYSEELAGGYAEGAKVTKSFVTMSNPLEVDAKGGRYDDLKFEGRAINTDELLSVAAEKGHDGLIIRNVKDGSSGAIDVYRPMSPDQVVSNLKGKKSGPDTAGQAQFRRDVVELFTRDADGISEVSPEGEAFYKSIPKDVREAANRFFSQSKNLQEAIDNGLDEDVIDAMKASYAKTEAGDKKAVSKLYALADKEFSRKANAPVERDPLDDMLDELRSGAVLNAKIPKRPVSTIVKSLGGIDPTSSFAGDLRSRGITAKSFPGLFRKGGVETLDNIPASEHPIFAGRATDGAGYIDQQEFINGLEAELKGEPWMTADAQKMHDDIISPLDDLEVTLDQMGIDYKAMSNDGVKARIKEIQDAEAIFARDTGQDAIVDGPRTLADIEKEARDEALAKGLDPDLAAADAVKPKIYINHARMNTAEDVRAALQQMADLDAKNITDKTRGVVSNEQTIKESSAEYRDLNDLIGRPPGPMNAAQATAARRVLASSGEQIVQLAKIAQAANASPADIFNFRRAMAVHYALQSEIIAARTETARALQAWSIPVGASKARSQAITDLIAQQGGAGDLQALAKAVASVGDNPTAINTMARELGRGRFGKALYQVWINGLLSGPKTHMVNITSNAMNALYAIPERYMAAGISKAFYDGEIKSGEATAQAFGLVKGIRDGFRLVVMGNKADGAAGVGDVFDAFAKVEGTTQNAISADALGLDPAGSLGYGIDMMGKIINAPGSALNAEDKFFKTISYRMELNALAYRQAASEGLEGKEAAARIYDILQNPPDTLKADAVDMAHYQTFTAPLSGGARQALGGIAKTPYIGPVFRMVVPFVKTPTNILKYTFARTPLAYASSAIRADISAGGARAAQAHARVALGSMIMLTVMDMVAEGTFTGGGPLAADMKDTQSLRSTRRAVGAPPPYSVKVGDRYYAYNRLDPLGMMIGMAADMSESFASADEADSEMLAGAGILAIAQNLASKSYLSGVFDFLGAMDPSNVTSDPGRYLSNFSGSMMPYSAFLRSTAQTFDPVARDSKALEYGEDGKVDPVATYLQGMINNMKKGIPGMSDELPPMRDLFGEPIDKSSGIGWGWDMVSPLASRADNPDPVSKAIIDNRIRVSFPERSINGVKLTPQEYDQFSELSGKGAKTYLDELVKSPAFEKMSPGPDGMRAEIIRNVIGNFREQARSQMMLKHPELRDRAIAVQRKNMQSLVGQ